MVVKIKPIIIGIAIIAILGLLLLVLRSPEDDWIKDSRGVWIKHGAPAETPLEVVEQSNAISCADSLFNVQKANLEEDDSRCLGKCGDYSVDIVNAPRTAKDNLAENQCEDYINKVTNHFIELDKNGGLVRII